jgi:hypothetical protein
VPYSHWILNAWSLYKAGFAVPDGTLLLGLHMSVDRGMRMGPVRLAEAPICCSAIHQLVASLSGTISMMFVLNSRVNWITWLMYRTGGNAQANVPAGTSCAQSLRRALTHKAPGV